MLYVFILILVIVAIFVAASEGFASRQEKARAIFDWLTSNPAGTYAQYRAALARRSNIYEYESLRQLQRLGKLSYENVVAIV